MELQGDARREFQGLVWPDPPTEARNSHFYAKSSNSHILVTNQTKLIGGLIGFVSCLCSTLAIYDEKSKDTSLKILSHLPTPLFFKAFTSK